MPRPPDGDAFRPEIQGLRAVAVALVVAFHLWPHGPVPGGYVGVDAFFVVSGFLITGHLVRELTATGRLDLPRFWARRVRRLLPAGLLVLALSGLGVLLLAPSTTWHATGRQIAASALYAQNWVLAHDAVDYLAQDEPATVAQHYWSLSVEEQLYAGWPLLLLLLALLAARRRSDPRRTVVLGLAVVSAASLAWSVLATGHEQATAYFSTLTRVWEFGAGALAATALPRRTARAWLGWAGLVALVGAAALLTTRSAFPGWIALAPVLGTVALLRSGAPGGPATAGWWLSRRPLVVLGDLSYAVYLVHWPLVVLAPSYLGHELRPAERGVLVLLTLALAWLVKSAVEDPLRRGPLLTAARWRPFAFAATGMALLLAANVVLQGELDRREGVAATLAASRLAAPASCLGPAALTDPVRCGGVAGTGTLLAPTEVVAAQARQPLVQTCQEKADATTRTGCRRGVLTGARLRVALVGDSHATHWVPALEALAAQHGWELLVLTKSACPASDASRHVATEGNDGRRLRCDAFHDAVDRLLRDDPTITDVITSSMFSAYTWSSRQGRPLADPATGFARQYARWTALGKRVHVIADVPLTTGVPVPDCLARNPGRPLACAVPRTKALPPDPMVAAARRVPGVQVLALTDQLCDARRCYARVGDVITYRDRTHLSFEYARLLAPFVARQLGGPLV